MSFLVNPFISGGSSAPATIDFLASNTTSLLNPSQSSYTTGSGTFGSADPTRRIFVLASGQTWPVTGINIGGNVGVVHQTVDNTVSNDLVGSTIASAAVPTGTSGTITFTFANGVSAQRFAFFVYRVTNLSSTTPIDSEYQQHISRSPGQPLFSGSLTSESNGICLGVSGRANSSYSILSSTLTNNSRLTDTTTYAWAWHGVTTGNTQDPGANISGPGSFFNYGAVMTFR